MASASHFDDRGWPLPSGPARAMSPWNFEDMLRDRQPLTFLQKAGLVVGRVATIGDGWALVVGPQALRQVSKGSIS